ncbi:MAG: hypothetical protein WD749_05000 [Phycisphaerales bacterium]
MTPPKPPISKWRFLALYWAVILPLSFVGWGALSAGGIGSGVFRFLAESAYQWHFAGFACAVMIVQAAFLAPVREPGSRAVDWWWSRALRCALAGAAVGIMLAFALFAVLLVLDELNWLTPELPLIGDLESASFFIYAAPPAALTALALFFRSRTGASARVSLFIAAFGAGLMAMGIPWVAHSLILNFGAAEPPDRAFAVAIVGTLLVSWAIATPLLLRFLRRGHADDRLGRVAAWLFTGTVVEAAAVIPLDIMVRRKTDCYCGEGTLWTLTICWGVGLWALGPAIWLIPLARRRKRWYAGVCPVCGYDMTGLADAPRCPECGSGWKAAV